MTNDLPSYRARFVQLAALWAYGVSAPLLVVIDGNPELVISRDLSRLQVALVAAGIAIVPPALAIGYTRLASLFSRWVADVVFLTTVGAFLVPLAFRLLKPLDTSAVVTLLLAATVAVTGVVLYARSHALRLFLTYSIALPVVALAWFVHGVPSITSEAHAAPVRAASPAPVVMLVLDELPASSLMTQEGTIDAVRYPGFGRLARATTWYPNATTVHEWTSDAVPSLLTGQVGASSTLPTVENHPENLFTLLGRQYSVAAQEYGTRLCPESICPREHDSWPAAAYGLVMEGTRLLLTRSLPQSLSREAVQVRADIELADDSDASLAGYAHMLEALGTHEGDARLSYTHVLLPHAPFRFLPSGKTYDSHGMDGWLPSERWTDDDWAVLQGYQRHLLQVGYTDRLLGAFVTKLEQTSLWDRALVIVVADHGASFQAGEGRRPLTGGNLADIANVPLFIKYPGQVRGSVNPRPARTIDVVPTIADVLGVHVPWKLDGSSLRGARSASSGVAVAMRGHMTTRASLAQLVRERQATLQRKVAAFGSGADSLYRIGENRWLLGRDASDFAERTKTVAVEIDTVGALEQADRSSRFVPSRISGHVKSGRLDEHTELALAVNGRFEALTRPLEGTDPQRFRALVPERSIRDGANRVDVYAVRGRGPRASVVWIGSSD